MRLPLRLPMRLRLHLRLQLRLCLECASPCSAMSISVVFRRPPDVQCYAPARCTAAP